MAERRIKVYIVDDDLSVRLSLSALLSAHGLLPRAFASAEEFLAAYKETRDACLLLDLRMPGMGGMALQQELISRQAHLPVIILTAHGDVPLAVEAMKAGAIDFIEKPGSEEHILNAIKDATRHRDARTAQPSRSVVSKRLAKLTAREREVLDHLVQGKTNKTIADELGISQRTVEIHRARIREKMEARGLADLIRMMR